MVRSMRSWVLNYLVHSELARGIAQAATVAVFVLLTAWFAAQRGAASIGEIFVAVTRAIVQILVVGLLLVILMKTPWWTAIPVLAGMIVAAATIAAKRAPEVPRTFQITLICICAGAGTTILVMTALGIIDKQMRMLLPVGSMIIANTMNIAALYLNRFVGEIRSHIGELESAIALGAAGDTAALPYSRAAFRASLIPAIDNLRSLGIVWIPGIMAGMVLSGSSPLYAALYQFVVLGMIFISGSITSITASQLLPRNIFNAREQLLIRDAVEE
jgi:putative ABC transport system permease protein